MTSKPTADVRRPTSFRRSGGFTLTELLVAMGIIAVVAGITVVGVGTLARDAKLASASNAVVAALDTARGVAIRDNRLTAVVFRPRVDGNRQYIEIVTTQWTGEAPTILVVYSQGPRVEVVDRFAPVPGVAARRLPSGITIAGPNYGGTADDEWQTPSHFPAQSEARGHILGVMFAGDGTVAFRNSISDSARMFVDFNGDRIQNTAGGPMPFDAIVYMPPNQGPTTLSQAQFNDQLFLQYVPDGEPFISLAPFLAVFDDDRVRSEYDASAWTNATQRRDDYTEYITNRADRIHFNRYTGVVMR